MWSAYAEIWWPSSLLLVHNKLPPVDTVMDFPPRRSLTKDFSSSFMGSLLLLNVQWQEKKKDNFVAMLCPLTTNTEQTHRSGFTGLSQLEVGDSSGCPVPWEQKLLTQQCRQHCWVALSGVGRRGDGVRGLTSLYPPVSLNEQKSFLLSPGLA